MSDITHARKAEELIRDHGSGVAEIDLAMIHAELATARAAREIDTTIRQSLRSLQDALEPDPQERPEPWLSWQVGGQHYSLNVSCIRGFSENGDSTVVTLDNDLEFVVPLSYGTVAMTVGA